MYETRDSLRRQNTRHWGGGRGPLAEPAPQRSDRAVRRSSGDLLCSLHRRWLVATASTAPRCPSSSRWRSRRWRRRRGRRGLRFTGGNNHPLSSSSKGKRRRRKRRRKNLSQLETWTFFSTSPSFLAVLPCVWVLPEEFAWFGFFWETSSDRVSLFSAVLGTTVATCSNVCLVGSGTFRGFFARVDLGSEVDSPLPSEYRQFVDSFSDDFRNVSLYSTFARRWINVHASVYGTSTGFRTVST